jgi:outer membrane protein TolC
MQAEENLRRIQNRAPLDAEKAYRKLEDSKLLLDVAEQAQRARTGALRIARDQRETRVISPAKFEEVRAAALRAELESLQARFGVLLAAADIERLVGRPLSN